MKSYTQPDPAAVEGGILVVCNVVGKAKSHSGATKKDNSPYTMTRTPVLIGDRFGEVMEYSRRADDQANHHELPLGRCILLARNVAPDPRSPALLKISLSDITPEQF